MMDTRKKKKYGHRAIVSLLAALALAVSIVPNATKDFEVAHAAEAYKPVHRLYNPNSGDHHYTTEVSEKQFLEIAGWNYEGIGWFAATQNESPVYRLYNPNAYCFNHHYTMDKNEREFLLNVGWKNEGIGWYSYNGSDSIPVFRVYNPNSGEHHYTKDESERNYLVSLDWNDEGVAWYGSPASSDDPTEPTTPTEPIADRERDLTQNNFGYDFFNEPIPTNLRYAYKTEKTMAVAPGVTGAAPIKNDYSDWTTSGMEPYIYEWTAAGQRYSKTMARYAGNLSKYTGYWGPGPRSSMYSVEEWGEEAATAEDVFPWHTYLKNSSLNNVREKSKKVTAAEFPISEEYVYRRMQARITEHDDLSPYAADDKGNANRNDDVIKEWRNKQYYDNGVKGLACAAYAMDMQDYAFGYAYNQVKYRNITTEELLEICGTASGQFIPTNIIKKCIVPLRVGDIIKSPGHFEIITKVYETDGRLYIKCVGGNAGGYTYTEMTYCLNESAGHVTGGSYEIWTRWTEPSDQYGYYTRPLGLEDVEYYANGAHTLQMR